MASALRRGASSGSRAIAHLRFDRMDGPLTAGGAAILATDEQAQATP